MAKFKIISSLIAMSYYNIENIPPLIAIVELFTLLSIITNVVIDYVKLMEF